MTPLELVLGILIVFVGYWLPPVVQKVREYLALTGKKDYSRVQSVTSGLIGMEKKRAIERYIRLWLWFEERMSDEELKFCFPCDNYGKGDRECLEYPKFFQYRKEPYVVCGDHVWMPGQKTADYINEYYGFEGLQKWKEISEIPLHYQVPMRIDRWIDILPNEQVYDEIMQLVKAPYSRRFRKCT